MLFPSPLEKGTLIRRYKRFLADIQLESGEILTVHCPNTGSMKNCIFPGADAWFSRSNDTKRKYACTWEIATTPEGHWIGINTMRANALVREALENKVLAELSEYDFLKAEVIYGNGKSRVDFVLASKERLTYVEVKSVTLAEDKLQGFFPDSVSVRGTKHLRELQQIAESGQKAVLIYCVQHSGIKSVSAAAHIDSEYAAAFRQAVLAGVQFYALGARISPNEMVIDRVLPVIE